MDVMEQEAINHLIVIVKVFGPMFASVTGIIAGLIVWAWKKMEKSQDQLERSITSHVIADDVIHDKLFDEMRTVNEKVAKISGLHEANHPGQEI